MRICTEYKWHGNGSRTHLIRIVDDADATTTRRIILFVWRWPNNKLNGFDTVPVRGEQVSGGIVYVLVFGFSFEPWAQHAGGGEQEEGGG